MSSSESSPPQVHEFLDKLDEIWAVFVLGQRSLPFLEELLCFVEDITVLIEEVDATIQTHTGHMHQAADQLKSVSEATEVATSEILDYTDEVLTKLGMMKDGMIACEDQFDGLSAADEELLALLQNELGDDHAALLEEVERIQEKKESLREKRKTQLDESIEALSAIRSKMNQITMSLQVQDITEQQLTSVNHLIETVRERIDTLLGRLGTGQASEGDMPSSDPPQGATFDANARYDRSSDRQRRADELINSMTNGSSSASADEDETRSRHGSRPSDSEEHTDPGEAASHSNIDQMYRGKPEREKGGSRSIRSSGDREVASQEDIDELFQQGS